MHSQKAARPGPLVAPVAGPQPYDWGRVSRQLVLPEFGDEAQRRLAGARVLIVGAGGLGVHLRSTAGGRRGGHNRAR